MNFYRSIFAIVLLTVLSATSSAQNIFPQKVKGCDVKEFCLDCGDPKAEAAPGVLEDIAKDLNKNYKFNKTDGGIMFQVLVDSLGQGCVLSHTDKTNSLLTKGMIGYLNVAKWFPAISGGKPVMSSINVIFMVSGGKISGRVQRI